MLIQKALRPHGHFAYLSYWPDPPWCEGLGGSWSGLWRQLMILYLHLYLNLWFDCRERLRFHLFAFLFTALQAHVHLVLLLHFTHFCQVEADAVPVEPVITATTADHEPTNETWLLLLQASANKWSKHQIPFLISIIA